MIGSKQRASCWLASFLAVVALIVSPERVHAAGLWCAVNDSEGHRVFISDLTSRSNFTKFETWRLSARFAAAVNGRYLTHFRGGGDVCRVGTATTLSRYRGDMARLGLTLIVVGVY